MSNDVFISYKHKDLDFVLRLEKALEADGRGVWVDKEGIPPIDEFQKVIDAAIESAQACVFILSPEHAESPYCRLELEHAIRNNKRLIPVVRRDVDDTRLNPILARKNFIWMRDQDDFETGLANLREALDTDLDWVHEHTRLLTRAIDWNNRRRDDSLTLQGRDLRDAETWLAQAGAGERLRPTPLQTEFIQYSRRIANRRYRFLVSGVTVALCLVAVLGVIGVWEGKLARLEKSRQAILDTLARSARAGAFSERAVTALADADAASAEVYCALALENEDRPDMRERLAEARARAAPVVWPRAKNDEEAGANPGRAISAAPGFSSLPVTVQDGKIGLSAVALDPGGRVFAVCCPPPSPSASRQKTEGPVPHWQNGSIWIGSVTRSDPDFELAGSAPPSTASRPDSFGGAILLVFCPGRNLLAACDAAGNVRLWKFDFAAHKSQLYAAFSTRGSRAKCLAISPDGRRLAEGGEDGKIRLWEIRAAARTQTLPGHEGTVSALAFSANGQRLASGGWDHTVRVWKAQGSANRAAAPSRSRPSAAFVSPLSQFVPLYTLRKHEDLVESLAFSEGAGKLASGGDDNLICVWNLGEYDLEKSGETEKTEPEKTLRGHVNSIISLAFMRGSEAPERWLVSGSADSSTRLWDLEEGEANLTLRGQQSDVAGVAFRSEARRSETGQDIPDIQIVSLAANGARRGWSVSQTGQRTELQTPRIPPVPGAGRALDALAFDPAAPNRIAAGGWDHTLRFWNQTEPISGRILHHSEDILCAAYSSDGRYIAYSSREPKNADTVTKGTSRLAAGASALQLRAVNDLTIPLSLPLPLPAAGEPPFSAATIRSVTFSRDGRLAACNDNGVVLVWRITQAGGSAFAPVLCGGYRLAAPMGQSRPPKGLCLAFSQDGRYLGIGSKGGKVYVADTRAGNIAQSRAAYLQALNWRYPAAGDTISEDSGDIWGIGFSPDGSRIAFANDRGHLLMCATQTGLTVPLDAPAHQGAIWSLAYSPDGRWIATAGQDSTVRLWDVKAGKQRILRCSRRPVWVVTFSQDSKRLAACGLEGKARIWNLDALNALFTTASGSLKREAERHAGLQWDERSHDLVP